MTDITDYLSGLRTPATIPTRTTALYGRPLVYLTGAKTAVMNHPGAVVEAPYGKDVDGERTFKIAYCNLFNENYDRQSAAERAALGPYLRTQFSEARIDPAGAGWLRNLTAQFALAKAHGYDFIELDNAREYSIDAVLSAVEVANDYRLRVIAKNPQRVVAGALEFVKHPNVWGMIVERGAGNPAMINALRKSALKEGIIPVWFVFDGPMGANQCAEQIRHGGFRGMGVTYSTGRGGNRYSDSVSVLTPSP